MVEFLWGLDVTLFLMINGLAGQIPLQDHTVLYLAGSELFKGLPVMMLLWGLWFADPDLNPGYRPRILAVLVVSIVAIVVGRALALLLPFRLRPIHDPDVPNILPFSMEASALEGWSSMPSDHAVLFFALATGIFLIHRGWGAVALIHAALVIGLPRVYAGFHFPGDILAGAFIGTLCAIFLIPPMIRAIAKHGLVTRMVNHPVLFYPAMFFVTFQSASMFNSARAFASNVIKLFT